MPLPDAGQPWPPAPLTQITAKQAEWDAWYAGDTDRLRAVYSDRRRTPVDKVAQYRGGVRGAVARMWWGKPVGDLTRNTEADKLHVPLASDLCQASADLLFAEPPTISSKDTTAQTELDNATEQLMATLAEAAEIGAALGDVYLRTTWDETVADRSWIHPVHADAAWPEFRWGRLVAVTFWWVVRTDGQVVVRHLERHELDGTGRDAVGVICPGLYEGTTDKLGRLVPLAEHPGTAGLVVDAESKISTQSPGLAVAHVPNQRPQRRWRHDPIGANLGRSDLDGVEGLMDKLDMVYTSWMRDVRLARGRIIVPSFMLESNGPGRGAFFDDEQDVFTSVNTPPREDGATQITPQQFEIRVEQHRATCQQLVEDILRTAGYSRQTFGEGDEVAQTATEVTSKDRRSALTRDRKIRAMRPALTAVLRKKLAVDAALFSTGVGAAAEVSVDFVDVTQADPLVLAQTSDALFRAQAASTKTRVQLQHPDWDEETVNTEVALIREEFSVSVPDPAGFRPGVDDQGTGAAAAGDSSAVLDVGSADAGQP